MDRTAAIGAAVALLLLGGSASPALAHGGQYRSPATAPPETGGGGEPTGPGSGKGGIATEPDWESWWWAHRERVRDRARRRREAIPAASGEGLAAAPPPLMGPAAPPPPPDPGIAFRREILPVLTAALGDPEAEVRSAAAVALGKAGHPRSLLPLHGALDDPHPDVRDAALLAMGMIGDSLALEDLRLVLFDPAVPERTRGFAAPAVGRAGGPPAGARRRGVISPAADAARVGGIRRSEDLLCCAFVALGRTGAPEAAAALRKEFASPVRRTLRVRCFAGIALARLGDVGAIPLLLQGLVHDDARMRQSSALALGDLASPEDLPVVAALARAAREDADAGAREFALHALGSVGGPPAVAVLREAWREGRREDRLHAALALGAAGDLPSAVSLHRALREAGAAREWSALALSLGMMGYRTAAKDLLERAGKGDPVARSHALSALGLLGEREAAAAARTILLEERDPRFHLVAAECLRALGDRTVVPDLVRRALGGGGVQERAGACYLLGVLGGEEAMRTLLRVAGDRGGEMILRMHAVAGLGVLADRSPVPLLADYGAGTNFLLPVGPLLEIQTFL